MDFGLEEIIMLAVVGTRQRCSLSRLSTGCSGCRDYSKWQRWKLEPGFNE